MAFENISKGEFAFIIGQSKCSVNIKSDVNKSKNLCVVQNINDAEFISYCFNLQQRYDISKLEEAVKLLEKMSDNMTIDLAGIKQLLKQIKK